MTAGEGLAPGDLAESLARLAREHPDARLVRNDLGNLAVLVRGRYAGWVDLAPDGGGEVYLYEDLDHTGPGVTGFAPRGEPDEPDESGEPDEFGEPRDDDL